LLKSHNFELGCLKKKEKHFGCLVAFYISTFDIFSQPSGMLLVMKTPEDEQYIDIKAYKFTAV